MANILVVEDNEQLGSMMVDVVESWGFDSILVGDGRSCLKAVEDFLPDIILLDVMLPGLNGYEICSQLKSNPHTSDIAIIMISALTDTESRIHSFKVGADNFLVKPVNYDELRAIISKLLLVKEHNDAAENRGNVVASLRCFIQAVLGNKENDEIEQALLYASKIATLLDWSADKADKVSTALILRKLYCLPEKIISKSKAESMLAPLRMSVWLSPVLQYVRNYEKGISEKLYHTLEQEDVLDVADIVLLLDRLMTICKEEKNDLDLSLAVLKRDAIEAHYNQGLLKKLEQVINDEKFLQNM